MPNLTIYVDAGLAAAIKRHNLSVSPVCQAALRRRVRMAERGARVVRNADGRIVGGVSSRDTSAGRTS